MPDTVIRLLCALVAESWQEPLWFLIGGFAGSLATLGILGLGLYEFARKDKFQREKLNKQAELHSAQLNTEIKLHRARLTSDIVSSWDDRMMKYRKILANAYREYWVLEPSISKQLPDPATVAKADPKAKPEIYEIKEAAIYILNFFEDFAALYLDEHIDKEIANKLLKAPILGMYQKITPLREAINKEIAKGNCLSMQRYGAKDNDDAWPVLRTLVRQWEPILIGGSNA